jgi:uncharacterized peroxidase-related enzyme
MHDHTQATLDPQLRGMLDYAVKLTRDPSSVKESDLETLRGLGLSDAQILAVCLVTCMFNFMTRLADCLGVENAPMMTQFVNSWLTGPATEQDWLVGTH